MFGYPLAGSLLFLFVIVGCSDDDTDPVNPPTITTLVVTEITEFSAKSGGNITDDGGGEVTARGVVWGTEPDPSLENHLGSTDDGTGSGVFRSDLAGLHAETTYFVRAYATNSAGTAYGNDLVFETASEEDDEVDIGEGTVMDIDGNVYQTVVIGDQEWMAENLRVTRYHNEDDIPGGLSDEEWENNASGAYAIYPHVGGEGEDDVEGIDSDDEMVAAYGKLYNWHAIDDSRGLCPPGWSIPSDADWMKLAEYVVSQGFPNELGNPNGAGNALKSCRQVSSPLEECNTPEHPRWNPDDSHYGFDEFGFSALPGGYRYNDGSFKSIGLNGTWWSSSEHTSTSAWYRILFSNDGGVSRLSYDMRNGLSVRCIRDID